MAMGNPVKINGRVTLDVVLGRVKRIKAALAEGNLPDAKREELEAGLAKYEGQLAAYKKQIEALMP